jgi:hypothetical protein
MLLTRLDIAQRFTLGSLRAGGATAKFMAGTEVSALKYWGGWSSEKSLACYIQEATAMHVWSSMSDSVARALELRVAAQGDLLLDPLPVPWLTFVPRRLESRRKMK